MTLQTGSWLPITAFSLSTGPISAILVHIGDLDTNAWENGENDPLQSNPLFGVCYKSCAVTLLHYELILVPVKWSLQL